METIFMNTENSKTNETHRLKLDLTDKLNLKNPKKNLFYCRYPRLLWVYHQTTRNFDWKSASSNLSK